MDRTEAEDICRRYRESVETGDRVAFRDLWTDDPRLVVAYGLEISPFEAEKYIGKTAIEGLIFGASHRLENPTFSNDRVFLIADDEAAFFWQFHLEIKIKGGGPVFDNDLLVQMTIEDGKIKEFLEFGDPRKRGALFRYLA